VYTVVAKQPTAKTTLCSDEPHDMLGNAVSTEGPFSVVHL
jgi:hypothetical protein